jgi:hypothetical protein
MVVSIAAGEIVMVAGADVSLLKTSTDIPLMLPEDHPGFC